MREYETIVVVDGAATEARLKELDDRVSKTVQRHGGEVFFSRPWGKRLFAYPVQKKKEGYYMHYDYCGDEALVAEIERTLRLDEQILRFLTVQLSESVDIAARKEQLNKQVEVAHV